MTRFKAKSKIPGFDFEAAIGQQRMLFKDLGKGETYAQNHFCSIHAHIGFFGM